ncbi:molybdate ABC transporter permease subunit [Cystobacter ferrugineus]|uniref:Molybdenum transport system permease n=1 Tax=Cystobacter ferrugineus TaxID=83449 RepID=A0A1L9AYC7_9BACT|nr:molybdate ABC transporter permease subunit [Cystobacter ferrugineus]OJH35021.1 molybdenum ABC transporter permease subunit [Cystobacter ferrugineus]
MDPTALLLSLRLAGWTTMLLLPLGLPIAWWLARSRWRWKFLLEALVALPLVLPPTVLGFYLLRAMGPQGPLGPAFESLSGHPLPFSFEGLLLASVISSLPFSVQPFTAALAGVDPRLIEASWCLGVSRARTFFRVVLPLAATGILSGMVLTFAHALGEFGVVLMVGGNLPGRTRTASIAIYDAVQALDYDAAGRMSLVLLIVSFVVLALTQGLRRGRESAWTRRS